METGCRGRHLNEGCGEEPIDCMENHIFFLSVLLSSKIRSLVRQLHQHVVPSNRGTCKRSTATRKAHLNLLTRSHKTLRNWGLVWQQVIVPRSYTQSSKEWKPNLPNAVAVPRRVFLMSSSMTSQQEVKNIDFLFSAWPRYFIGGFFMCETFVRFATRDHESRDGW